jgi:hypothetical protein
MEDVLAANAVDLTPREEQAPGIESFKKKITSFRTSLMPNNGKEKEKRPRILAPYVSA